MLKLPENFNEMTENNIAKVLTGLLASIDKQNLDSFLPLLGEPIIEQALQQVKDLDAEGFYFKLLYPISNTIDGLLSMHFPHNNEVQFIFKHLDFLEGHLQKLFETHEGSACCADKARTVIRALLRYYSNGTETVFNFEAEYTYHLPKRILKTHAEIIAFFEALRRLYYGRTDAYLSFIASLEASLSGSAASNQSAHHGHGAG